MRGLGGTGVANTWAMPRKVVISELRTGESLKISATPAVRFMVGKRTRSGPSRRTDAGPRPALRSLPS
jgi:hypothetical protein